MDVHIHKDNGEIVSREYLRRRVSTALSKWRRVYTLNERQDAIARTIDCNNWLRAKQGYTVGAVIRAVQNEIYPSGLRPR